MSVVLVCPISPTALRRDLLIRFETNSRPRRKKQRYLHVPQFHVSTISIKMTGYFALLITFLRLGWLDLLYIMLDEDNLFYALLITSRPPFHSESRNKHSVSGFKQSVVGNKAEISVERRQTTSWLSLRC